MTVKKKDTWGSLASLLGIAAPAETASEPNPVDSAPEESTPAAEAIVSEPVLETVAATPAPVADLPAELEATAEPTQQPIETAPPAPKPPKKRDRWDSLLGQLGLATPEPADEVEPEPPPKPAASKPSSRTPFLKTPPVRETAAKALPPKPTVTEPVAVPEASSALDEETVEGPPGYQGPDLMQRLQAERELERQKIANQRSSFDKLFQAGVARSSKDDEVNYDDELNSGLKALWDDNGPEDASIGELSKPEEPKREFARRDETRRNEPRRDAPRREETRHEGPRREEPRRENPRREESRRDRPNRDEGRREDVRREEPRRVEARRDEIPPVIDELEDDLLLDAPRENLAGEEGDGQPRKRRRRRRGRRRGSREGTEAVPGAVNEKPLNAEVEDFIDESGDDLPPAEITDESSELPRGRDEAGRPPRKRRRRRRRSEETTNTEKPKAASVVDHADDFDDEFDGPASLDYHGDDKFDDGHKGIPTWDDAVGSIVTANLEARGSRPSHGGSRGRDGGGRDGGRGRGGRR